MKILTGNGTHSPLGYFVRSSDGARYVPIVKRSDFYPFEYVKTTFCFEIDDIDGTDY